MVEQAKKLHLGCGLNTPEGWTNIDGSWNAWFMKYPFFRNILRFLRFLPEGQLDIPWSPNVLIHDVRKPLRFRNNSVLAIYSSHLLEHLYRDEARLLLKECFRVLAPGGTLRAVVPDLRHIVDEYLDPERYGDASMGVDDDTPADRLNRRLLLRPPQLPAGNIIYRIYSNLLDYHSHKWMYDTQSLISSFRWAGFEEVEERQLHQSRIEGIETIEKRESLLDMGGICVEGIKPRTVSLAETAHSF